MTTGRRECWARCKRCGLDFHMGVSVPCNLEVYIAALKALRCPSCGKRGKHLFAYSPGLTPAEAAASRGFGLSLG